MTALRYCLGIVTLIASTALTEKVHYNGDQVLSIVPLTLNHAEHIKTISNDLQLDLWQPSIPEDIFPGREVHVRVPAALLQTLKQSFLEKDISYRVMINDVQKLIDENPVKENRKMSLASFDYTKYHPMDVIYEWMEEIKETHKDLVSLHYLGSTYELRPINYMKIGLPSQKKKKIIWMDCGIHAREWISVAFCQWFIRELLESHSSNHVIHKALENMDFYIVPVVNIDGFIYSRTTERLWRKTRSPYNNGTCYGVDLNRNFDSSWCSIGASTNCTSLTFCGRSPASEPETQAVSQLVNSLKADILCYLTMHSYGHYLLLPYGYTHDVSINHEEMMDVGQKAAAKIAAVHGTQFAVGTAAHVLYSNAGSSMDWANDLGLDFSYTFELRDNGTFGFILPEDQIKASCEETTAGVLSIVDYLNEKHFSNAAAQLSRSPWIYCSFFIIISKYMSLY